MPSGRVDFIGMPWVIRYPGSRIILEANTTVISSFRVNAAGINHPTILSTLAPGSCIHVGRGSGVSGATLVAASMIEIGSNSGLGVNTAIYDTDFHVEDPILRRYQGSVSDAPSAPVRIGDDVWIAANVMVLKGVTIGDRAVIGAGAVVTRDVASECIFAGNPAKMIRRVRRAE